MITGNFGETLMIEMLVKFLKIFTDLNVDKINKIKDEDINQLKIKLANEATVNAAWKRSSFIC